jgi:hypothetical protein
MYAMNQMRLLHMSRSLWASASLSKHSVRLIQDTLRDLIKPDNTALYAYHYFKQLKQIPDNPILTKEYRQLPDDSQFIDKHYQELVQYRDQLCGVGGRYEDLSDVSELFLKLSKLHPGRDKSAPDPNNSLRKMQVDRFDQFVEDLTHTMKLTGGHLYILDLLIYNREVFEHCERTHNRL